MAHHSGAIQKKQISEMGLQVRVDYFALAANPGSGRFKRWADLKPMT
jgi:hypothetical protein